MSPELVAFIAAKSAAERLNVLVKRDGPPPQEFIELVEDEGKATWNKTTQLFEDVTK